MDDNKQRALAAALGQIEKQFGKGSVMRMGDRTAEAVETIGTGSLMLDIALGIGGLPKGRVVEIYGPESSGKTTLTLQAIAECQKGKRVVMVYPLDKWVLMLIKAIVGEHGNIRNLGDVKWLATEDNLPGKGTGRHIACFILEPREDTGA